MKKFAIFSCGFVLFVFITGCSSAPPKTDSITLVELGENESLIVIQRASSFIGSGISPKVLIDGQERGKLPNGGELQLVVPNGTHKIQTSSSFLDKSSVIDFSVNSEKIIFSTKASSGLLAAKFNLEATSKQKLSNEDVKGGAISGVEGALARAAQDAVKSVLAKSKLAIVYITAPDKNTTDYIAGELEYIWVNNGFTIIDRSQLDKLRQEQNLQMSGDIDDATAVSIGKFAGADIIITGRVDGEGNLRRLRLRALNTQTAQVVGAASEAF